MKTEVFENAYVTAHLHVPAYIAISVQACVVQRKYGRAKTGDENGCFYPSSVDGVKRCENANVDVNTFIRFRETENGGFRKRISVDGASVSWPMNGNDAYFDRDLTALLMYTMVFVC